MNTSNSLWKDIQIDFEELRRSGIDKLAHEFEKAHTYPASNPTLFSSRTADQLFEGFKPARTQNFWGYLHVPFCNYLCDFCFYAKVVAKDRKHLVTRYLVNLERQIDSALARLNLDAFTMCDLYIGGGTPTALNEDELERFISILQLRFRFGADTLITVEGTPDSFTSAKIALLRDFGVQRFSFGLQSAEQRFLDGVQLTFKGDTVDKYCIHFSWGVMPFRYLPRCIRS